jgi:hypothetical protein
MIGRLSSTQRSISQPLLPSIKQSAIKYPKFSSEISQNENRAPEPNTKLSKQDKRLLLLSGATLLGIESMIGLCFGLPGLICVNLMSATAIALPVTMQQMKHGHNIVGDAFAEIKALYRDRKQNK